MEKYFIFPFHVHFSASFAFYFLVSYKYFQTSVLKSFNIETLASDENPPLYTSFIKLDLVIATFKNLLNMAALEVHLNKVEIEKVR